MKRGIVVWISFMALETVHGILRSIFLVPVVGRENSNLIGWPIAAAIVLGVTVLTSRWVGLSTARALFGLGALWAALTLIFEVAIGLLQGMDAAQITNAINPLSGGLMIYTLLVVFIAPYVGAKLRQ